MDPVSLIVMALAAGAAAGLKPAAENAVKDAYAGIKRLIQDRYAKVDVAPLEQKPESEAKQASLEEDLKESGAGADEELLAKAREVFAAVKEHDPEAAAAVGVLIEDVGADNLRIKKIEATGTGLELKRSKFEGDIDIGEVRAGGGGPTSRNPP